jgi:hypothetical protein
MEDPAEQLIRRALGRRPPPKLGPTLADDVLRRVASPQPRGVSGGRAAARRFLAGATWLVAAVASVAVLAHLEWSSGARAVAWGLALAMVPLAYSATLWPDRALALLALCGGTLLGASYEEPRAVSPGSPGGRRRCSSASPR